MSEKEWREEEDERQRGRERETKVIRDTSGAVFVHADAHHPIKHTHTHTHCDRDPLTHVCRALSVNRFFGVARRVISRDNNVVNCRDVQCWEVSLPRSLEFVKTFG